MQPRWADVHTEQNPEMASHLKEGDGTRWVQGGWGGWGVSASVWGPGTAQGIQMTDSLSAGAGEDVKCFVMRKERNGPS